MLTTTSPRRGLTFALTAAALTSLTACQASIPRGTVTTATARSSTSPSPAPSASPRQVTITCQRPHQAPVTYQSITAAWAGSHTTCQAKISGDLDQVDEHVAETAGAPRAGASQARSTALTDVTAMCARNTPDAFNDIAVGNPTAITRAKAALVLCPDHPQWAVIARRTAQALIDSRASQTGGAIVDGTWKVGADAKPGAYTSDVTSDQCYWERADAKGTVIKNGIVLGGNRAEVTIAKTDAAFTSRGCGTWIPKS
ncbi:hypothetical protein [Arsenicicoccus sp. UBA7492]|uniref:hypothetical protein n=1 Tax=Arsenicicoccus sp. UBA7492 TaxID=1946057 RepID=UPI002580012B|nr:hypothetical protein [Arsenicicoccus sp. UBA7492]